MMQISNLQFKSIAAGGSMEMGSLAYLHCNFPESIFPSDMNSHLVAAEALFLQSRELSAYTLVVGDLEQSTPQVQRTFVSDVEPADISIAVAAIRDASASISFFEMDDAARNADMRFSVDVPADTAPADLSLDIDTERAAVFYITVSGMLPLDSGHKSVDSKPGLDLGRSRERLSAGRMICLLKQQLNL